MFQNDGDFSNTDVGAQIHLPIIKKMIGKLLPNATTIAPLALMGQLNVCGTCEATYSSLYEGSANMINTKQYEHYVIVEQDDKIFASAV